MYSVTRDDVKQLAQQVADLAKEMVDKLDSNQDYLDRANKLVMNTTTMVFAIGELYALEQSGMNKKVVGKVVSTKHNVRDSRGRFAPKV